jgi:hypothetical protein
MASKGYLLSNLNKAYDEKDIGEWPIHLESWHPKAEQYQLRWYSFHVSDSLHFSLSTLTWQNQTLNYTSLANRRGGLTKAADCLRVVGVIT